MRLVRSARRPSNPSLLRQFQQCQVNKILSVRLHPAADSNFAIEYHFSWRRRIVIQIISTQSPLQVLGKMSLTGATKKCRTKRASDTLFVGPTCRRESDTLFVGPTCRRESDTLQ